MSQMQKIVTSLSVVLRDETKRGALLGLRGYRAQCLVDFFDYVLSDPEFRTTTEPDLLKLVLAVSHSICGTSMRYPTCFRLSGIRDLSPTGFQGGRIEIYQGCHNRQRIGLKTIGIRRKQGRSQVSMSLTQEAFVWNQLDHPNIVPFCGVYKLDRTDRICLVSPWMENGNMIDYLESMPEAPRKSFIHDIASGLQYLHSQHIVHGDVQGRNVLINSHQNACLADFGLSTIEMDGTLGFPDTTENGMTGYWASPERLEGNASPTQASDVWAFGCVCYEVLAGMEPIAKVSRVRVIYKLRKGEIPTLGDDKTLDENENLDKKMRALLGKCWSNRVEERPGSLEVLRELESIPSMQCRHDPHPRSSPTHGSPYSPRFLLRTPGSAISTNLNEGKRILEELHRGPVVELNRG